MATTRRALCGLETFHGGGGDSDYRRAQWEARIGEFIVGVDLDIRDDSGLTYGILAIQLL